jgi:hypothetical protein
MSRALETRIAELIAANEATTQSLFICIMQFGNRQ